MLAKLYSEVRGVRFGQFDKMFAAQLGCDIVHRLQRLDSFSSTVRWGIYGFSCEDALKIQTLHTSTVAPFCSRKKINRHKQRKPMYSRYIDEFLSEWRIHDDSQTKLVFKLTTSIVSVVYAADARIQLKKRVRLYRARESLLSLFCQTVMTRAPPLLASTVRRGVE